MRANAPVDDDSVEVLEAQPSSPPVVSRRVRSRQRDVLVVGVMTPVLLLGLVAGLLVLGQVLYPDTEEEEPVRAPVTAAAGSATPVPTPVAVQPIDVARLNAGIVDQPPQIAWPEIEGLKVQPDPGRPNEHVDYTPALSDVQTRRLIATLTVNRVVHTSPELAGGAAEELAKAYPLAAGKRRVVDQEASIGYVVDESAFGVVFTFGLNRVQIETVAASPPILPDQRSQFESQSLHLADHIVRQLQDAAVGGQLTGPERTAVHVRDHVSRMSPFGG